MKHPEKRPRFVRGARRTKRAGGGSVPRAFPIWGWRIGLPLGVTYIPKPWQPLSLVVAAEQALASEQR